MKLAFTILVSILSAAAAPIVHADEWSAWSGALARWTLEAPDGETTRLAELRGDVVIVNFWASWCKPCKKELKHLDDWNVRLDGSGARIVAISVDHDARRMMRFVESAEITLPVYHDGPDGLAKTLALPSLPCTVVLDREGSVVRVVTDGRLESLRHTQDLVDTMVAPVAEGAAG